MDEEANYIPRRHRTRTLRFTIEGKGSGNVRGWEKNHWDAPRMWAHHAIENSIEWSRGPGTTDDVRDESVRP
jgi:hypothetical protein